MNDIKRLVGKFNIHGSEEVKPAEPPKNNHLVARAVRRAIQEAQLQKMAKDRAEKKE